MPWVLEDPRLQVHRFTDPSGNVWLYPNAKGGWAFCGQDAVVRVFRSRKVACREALKPAKAYAKERLAHFREVAKTAGERSDFKIRGQALRWTKEWQRRIQELQLAALGPEDTGHQPKIDPTSMISMSTEIFPNP